MKATFEVAVEEAAAESVTTLPEIDEMVVPGAMPAPLTYMPAERPVGLNTCRLVLPLTAAEGVETGAVTAVPKITVPEVKVVPEKLPESVSVVPETEATVTAPAVVTPFVPLTKVTAEPGMMLVPAGTVTVFEPLVRVSPGMTCTEGNPNAVSAAVVEPEIAVPTATLKVELLAMLVMIALVGTPVTLLATVMPARMPGVLPVTVTVGEPLVVDVRLRIGETPMVTVAEPDFTKLTRPSALSVI